MKIVKYLQIIIILVISMQINSQIIFSINFLFGITYYKTLYISWEHLHIEVEISGFFNFDLIHYTKL